MDLRKQVREDANDVIRKSQPDKTDKRPPRKVVIKVHPDQRVVATVPYDASDESMLKRARWI